MEGGFGRYDIALVPTEAFRDGYQPIIIEFKVPKERMSQKEYTDEELLALAEMAVEQIRSMHYMDEYKAMYEPEDFWLIGVGAQGKRCRVAICSEAVNRNNRMDVTGIDA